MSLKPKNKNSNKKNKNTALKDIVRTLSQKKYIEDCIFIEKFSDLKIF